ncbi:hypothetical protein DSM21852_38920 [Methylocystis bryophila]|nr:hypothetical protein DSM21852_38920 [Methylocystis bryophila]
MLDERRFDLRLGSLSMSVAVKARANNPRVIDDKSVAGAQKMRQVANMAVFQAILARGKNQHSRAISGVGGA